MGLTMSEWDDLDEHDRAWALAPDLVEAQDAAGGCSVCGGPASECQNPDNQRAFVVEFRRCFKTVAVTAARKKRADDLDGVVTVVRLDPAKKKSVTMRKG